MTAELMVSDGQLQRDRTRIPDWRAPDSTATGVGRHEADLPPELATAVQELADSLAVPVEAVLLTAHLKVVSVLTHEPRVMVGLAGPTVLDVVLPDCDWATLVMAVAEAERTESDDQPYDTLVHAELAEDPLPAGLAFALTWSNTTLRFDYERDRFDTDYIARTAGYHLTVLRALTADPDQPHLAATLLTPEQAEELVRTEEARFTELPDRRFHQYFEDHVQLTPQAPAVTFRGVRLSYAELNARANRIAHALLAEGLQAEDVVAVVTDRTEHWAAAVLGVFKAGGVYLPIDAGYPAERIIRMLRQGGGRFVLAAADSDANLRAGLAAAEPDTWCVLPLEATATGTGPATDPEVEVRAGQLAYVYFTSGSTGLPKGAMCEHLGMLNHLLAKVEAIGLRADDVVLQNAPMCFDISLWQLINGLLVGAHTVILAEEDTLDVSRFVDRLLAADVTVAQVVPSYLDVLLADLEARPRQLGRLRCVSVTGEAVGKHLVQRWFARYPHIFLLNGYGATEVSDDTTHAVIRSVPPQRLVPVGRPIVNSGVYVVDEQLRMVPPGAPGEVVFTGPCVGRGYINDPVRSGRAYIEDPYRPGARAYRTGDFGRWLADGNLEFLGRRDEQVKIRGMRVELGELEARVLEVPGVRTAAVVIRSSASGKSLIAFYTGETAPDADTLLGTLRGALPVHLVPAACRQLDEMPLTENGKVDKAALTTIAAQLEPATGPAAPPATPAERRIALLWAELLGRPVDEIGVDDDFFRLGGDSLAALRLVVKLDRAISLTDLIQHSVLREIAALLEDSGGADSSVLLLPLATPPVATVAVVAVPDAGGNAVNFQRLAKELEPQGIAVYGVEPPGHDLARPADPLAEAADTARRVHVELAARHAGRVLLWGHGTGAAVAIELARLLERDGAGAVALVIGGRVLDDPDSAAVAAAAVAALSDPEVKAAMSATLGFTELDELQGERAEVVGQAYRHDVAADARYFAAALADPQWQPLDTPLVAVLAAGDPTTAGRHGELSRWERLAARVTVAEIPGDEHYFPHTDPERTAQVVAGVVAGTGPVG